MCLGSCGQSVAIASPSISRAAPRLTALYEEHAASTFRFALHLTGRREDAEDVVQHVFIQAFRHLESGGELTHPRAWLMRATKHRSLNAVRDRREFPATNEFLDAHTSTKADPQEAEALAAVRATLWALPESQHQAFVLRHWSGLSQAEIAEVLETTPAAVESLLTRARGALVEEQASPSSECRSVRERLIEARGLTAAQLVHLGDCRKCRKAQTRLARAAGFAATFVLLPRAHVAHALASSIPGFTPPAALATGAAVGTTGAAGAAVPASALPTAVSAVAPATAVAKAAVATKLVIAAVIATTAVAAVHPLRQPVTAAIHDAVSHLSPSHGGQPAQPPTSGRSASPSGPPADHGTPNSHASTKARGSAAAHHAGAGNNGKSATHGSNGKGATHGSNGKSATHGSNGKGATNGQGATHTNGNANAHGNSSGAGASANGTTKGNSHATGTGTTKTTGKGKAKGKAANGHHHHHNDHRWRKRQGCLQPASQGQEQIATTTWGGGARSFRVSLRDQPASHVAACCSLFLALRRRDRSR